MITNFVATSAGIASYLALFRMEENVTLRKSAATFIITKIGDLIAVWLTLFITCTLLWDKISSLRIATIGILAAISLAIGIFILAIASRQGFIKSIRTLVRYLQLEHFSVTQRGLGALQFVAEQNNDVILNLLQISILCSLIYMTLGIIWTYASLRAFSMIIPYLIIVFVNSWIQLISWLPIQVFGGLGVIDTSQIYLFSLFGISVAQMATISVGLRVTSYLFNLLSPLYLPLYRLFQRKKSSDNPSKDQND